MAGHEFSGYTVGGISKALAKLGYAERVLPTLSEPARRALAEGGVFKFHPGVTMDETLAKVAAAFGDDACAALMEEVTRASLEGIVAPLARLYLTLKKNDPHALFEHFDDLLRGTARGLHARWAKEGPTAGTMTIAYPGPVPPVVAHGWRGALRHALRFAGVTGTVTVGRPAADGTTITLVVRWAS